MKSREVDAAVAEEWMGYVWRRNKVLRSDTPQGSRFRIGADFLIGPKDLWQVKDGQFERKKLPGGFHISGDTYYWVPHFSTDVVESLKVADTFDSYALFKDPEGGFVALLNILRPNHFRAYRGKAKTLPLAICRAALKAARSKPLDKSQ